MKLLLPVLLLAALSAFAQQAAPWHDPSPHKIQFFTPFSKRSSADLVGLAGFPAKLSIRVKAQRGALKQPPSWADRRVSLYQTGIENGSCVYGQVTLVHG